MKTKLQTTPQNTDVTRIQPGQSLRLILENRISENTRLAYKTDITHLKNYAEAHSLDLTSLTEDQFIFFLEDQINQGFAYTTIRRRIVGINQVLSEAFQFNFKRSEKVKELIKGLVRTDRSAITDQRPRDYAKDQASPITPKVLMEAIKAIDKDENLSQYASRRNKALLLLGYAGGFRRSELVAIRKQDLEFKPGLINVYLPKSKTRQKVNDSSQAKEMKPIHQTGSYYCPVQALRDLLEITGDGFIFQSCLRNGKPSGKVLSAHSFNQICKKYLGAEFSAHSIRAGLITTAYKNGNNVKEITEITGQTPATVMGYVRLMDKEEIRLKNGL